jgi:hypothetical protein
LLTVMARNAVHSALFLISVSCVVAALFVLSGAEFIAGVQILGLRWRRYGPIPFRNHARQCGSRRVRA